MENVVVIAVLLLVIGAAVTYIVRAKKRGVKCIGCPAGGSCAGNCGGKCSEQMECECGCSEGE